MPEKGKEDFGDPNPIGDPQVSCAEKFRGRGRPIPLTESGQKKPGTRSKISLDFFDGIKY